MIGVIVLIVFFLINLFTTSLDNTKDEITLWILGISATSIVCLFISLGIKLRERYNRRVTNEV